MATRALSVGNWAGRKEDLRLRPNALGNPFPGLATLTRIAWVVWIIVVLRGLPMSVRNSVAQVLEGLGEAELQQVADYVAFLKFRARARAVPPRDTTQFAARYAESAQEDRQMAEEAMADYADGLLAEDNG